MSFFNISAKKSLGQHFLVSKKVLADIIEAAQIVRGENILEIGPGTGVLTRALLETGAHIIAVEKDERAVEQLKKDPSTPLGARENNQLNLISGDILEIPAEKLNLSDGNYALVANIPYYITGAILEKFLEHEPRPNRMILLVQREVAERIVARDGKESILSLSVKAFGTPKIISRVPPGAFVPPPTVESAILSIQDISNRFFSEHNVPIALFFNILRAAFAHKRKFAVRNLETALPAEKIASIWSHLGLDPKIRAEDIPLLSWFDIARLSM